MLIVAGGYDEQGRITSDVELFDGSWSTIRPLPDHCCDMKSTIHNRSVYLSGGHSEHRGVFYCSENSLKVYGELKNLGTNLPVKLSSIASFKHDLVAVGGKNDAGNVSSEIFVHSDINQSWVHIGDMPYGLYDPATVSLPTGELVVICGCRSSGRSQDVTKISVEGKL